MNGRLEHDLKIQEANQRKLSAMPDFVREYYGHLKANHCTEATCRDYLSKVYKFLSFTNIKRDKFQADMITSNIVDAYMTSLETIKDKQGNVKYTSDSYKQTIWICLNGFMNFLVLRGYIEQNYIADIAKPKINDEDRINKKRVMLTADDFRSILKEVDKNHDMVIKRRDKAMLSLMMTTGMRESAVSEINIDNVDLDNYKIVGIAKGKKAMEYSFNDSTAKAIREWLAVRDGYAVTVTTDSLFISNRGERMAVNSIAKMCKKYTGKALGRTLSPHKLRAGYVSILYNQTGDIEFCRRAVGHASSKTTQRYIVTKGNEREEAANMIGI